jgi:hypothetical protein
MNHNQELTLVDFAELLLTMATANNTIQANNEHANCKNSEAYEVSAVIRKCSTHNKSVFNSLKITRKVFRKSNPMQSAPKKKSKKKAVDEIQIIDELVYRLKGYEEKDETSWHGYPYTELFKALQGTGDMQIPGLTNEMVMKALELHGKYKVYIDEAKKISKFVYISESVANIYKAQIIADETKLFIAACLCPSNLIQYPFKIAHSGSP